MSKKTEHSHPDAFSWFLLILLTLIWGSSFILIKKGLTVFTATQVSAIRILSASVFMVPFALSWLRKVNAKHYPLIFLSGFIGSLIPAVLFAVAQTRLDSSITGMVNALTPVCVIIIGILFYQQRTNGLMIIGLVLSFSGTAILMFFGGNQDYKINYYALFVVAATVLYGINVNILKFNLGHLNAVAISSISLFFVGPIAAVGLFFFTDFFQRLSAGGPAILALTYLSFLGIVGTSLALMIFNNLIKRTTPLFFKQCYLPNPDCCSFLGYN